MRELVEVAKEVAKDGDDNNEMDIVEDEDLLEKLREDIKRRYEKRKKDGLPPLDVFEPWRHDDKYERYCYRGLIPIDMFTFIKYYRIGKQGRRRKNEQG